MAVLRNGRYHRKASDGEAEAMQVRQAQATMRKLTRRIERAPFDAFRYFLEACRFDIQQDQEQEAVA